MTAPTTQPLSLPSLLQLFQPPLTPHALAKIESHITKNPLHTQDKEIIVTYIHKNATTEGEARIAAILKGKCSSKQIDALRIYWAAKLNTPSNDVNTGTEKQEKIATTTTRDLNEDESEADPREDNENIIEQTIRAFESERDPRTILPLLRTVPILYKLHNPTERQLQRIYHKLQHYFPIHFNANKSDTTGITPEELKIALARALAHPAHKEQGLQLMHEKYLATSHEVRFDVLSTLTEIIPAWYFDPTSFCTNLRTPELERAASKLAEKASNAWPELSEGLEQWLTSNPSSHSKPVLTSKRIMKDIDKSNAAELLEPMFREETLSELTLHIRQFLRYQYKPTSEFILRSVESHNEHILPLLMGLSSDSKEFMPSVQRFVVEAMNVWVDAAQNDSFSFRSISQISKVVPSFIWTEKADSIFRLVLYHKHIPSGVELLNSIMPHCRESAATYCSSIIKSCIHIWGAEDAEPISRLEAMKLLGQIGQLVPDHKLASHYETVMLFTEERLDDPKEIIRYFASKAGDSWR